MLRHLARLSFAPAFALLLAAPVPRASAQTFTIEDVLSPGYPMSLVSARRADRIAWMEYERGMRNVYTAAAPDFKPVRLTSWTADDGNDLTEVQISDDGAVVAFIRGHIPNRDGWIANPAADPRGAERAIWAVRTDGGAPWRVVEAWNLDLSPDGRWVAYAKDGEIYRARVGSGPGDPGAGQSERLVRVFGRQSDARWSPDSRRIAFESDRGDHSFIGVYDTRDASVVYLAPGVDRDSDPAWSADGSRIAFVRRPGLPFGARANRGGASADELPAGMVESRFPNGSLHTIWVADATTGVGREIWHNLPEDSVPPGGRELRWAGSHVTFMAEPHGWRHWYSVDAGRPGSDAVELTPGAGIAEHVALSPDGATLYYAANIGDIDRRHLFRVPVAGGRPTQLTRGTGIETYPAALASGGQVAVLSASDRRPQGVAIVPAGGGDPRVITTLSAAFPASRQVVPQAVTLKAEDGFEFYNQLFLPPDLKPGERRPALMFIHGGSRRQMLLGYHYMHFYHMAYAMNQYFANKGYVVISVNYRSGIGYGRAFRNAPGRGGEGNTEYRDILAAGRYLQQRPDVDPARVGVWGLSYGGILTAQALARNSDVFAAGVDMAGVHLYGNSIDPKSTSYRSSAASEVKGWKSPVLLIHGDDDRNVDFSQTVGLVQLLRANKVPYELIVFPDEVHDFLLHSRWLLSFNATDDFFQRTLIKREQIRAGAN